jgi:hypothetical protein
VLNKRRDGSVGLANAICLRELRSVENYAIKAVF